ncbi:MAG: hypothetical protein H6737_16620 [Alphaproteobacteria bacterium]|nr:hypothetical protein [Alphaproteobacteria bacterium]
MRTAPALTWLADGVRIDDPGFSVALTHASWGRPGFSAPFPDATVVPEGPRTRFVSDGIEAWYEAVPAGLEQGFTVEDPPAGDGWLEVRVGLDAPMEPERIDGALLWSDATGAVGRYHGLEAWDALGTPLPVALLLDCSAGCEAVLQVDDADAVYPVTIDPIVATDASTPTPPTGLQADVVGGLGQDGDWLAWCDRASNTAVIHQRSGSDWLSVQTLDGTESGGSTDEFCRSIDVSGSRIAVGARHSVVLYALSGATWVPDGSVDMPGDTVIGPFANAEFATRLALDGDILVVSAPARDRAAVYDLSTNTQWSLTPSTTLDFAEDVDVSGDTIVIGAPDIHLIEVGEVRIYERNGSNWDETVLAAPAGVVGDDEFGMGVSIDGDRMIVGAVREGPAKSGRAHIYERVGGVWAEDTVLAYAGPGEKLNFGSSVQIAGDIALISQPWSNAGAGFAQGAVDIWEHGADWTWRGTQIGSGPGVGFGQDVRSDGIWAAVRGKQSVHTFLLATADADGDGYASIANGGADCDDGNGAIHPGATELVGNTVDENCDGHAADIDISALGAGDLVIVELMANPVLKSSPAGQYVEILNLSGQTVALDGLTLQTSASGTPVSTVQIEALEVAAGDPVVVGQDVATFDAGFVADGFLDAALTFPASGSLALVASGTIDAVSWTSLPSGASRSLDTASMDAALNDDLSALPWCDGLALYDGGWGTPGVENDRCRWTLDFDFDWVFTADNTHIEGTTDVLFRPDGTMRTGNGGTGTGSWSTSAAGQTVTWSYDDTFIVYSGTRPHGADCWPSGSMSGQPATVEGWWTEVGCDPCPGDADSDNDEVCDAVDQCPGDDHLDTDLDGTPDGCDPCPLDNPDDTDGDTVCDSDDLCPGEDDTIDGDGDTIGDCADLCPFDNPNDADSDGFCDSCPDAGGDDTDGDGLVDGCDPCPLDDPDDTDRDGLCDSDDPCPLDPLDDADGDGVCGDVDVCPLGDDGVDTDSDGVPDACDPCPQDNPNDFDGDGDCDSGDVCPGFDDTIDTDEDGIPDGCDTCPRDRNDRDSDGVCDMLDPCPDDNPDDSDSDGVCDTRDICPGFDDLADADFDTVPDGCDACPDDADDDIDGDGLCADVDPCPKDPSPFDDWDGDGVCNSDDLCPTDADDTDGDGVDDDCDACPTVAGDDLDDDGVCDSLDVCLGGDDAEDTDGDGIPDFCDDDSWCNNTGGGGFKENPHFDDWVADGDVVYLRPANRPGECLDWFQGPVLLVPSSSINNWTCDGSEGQKWVWREAYQSFEAYGTGQCLNLTNATVAVAACASVPPIGVDSLGRISLQSCGGCLQSNGAQEVRRSCTGSLNQRYAIEPAIDFPTIVTTDAGTVTANGRPRGLSVWGPHARPILTSPDRNDLVILAAGATRGGGRVGVHIGDTSGTGAALADVEAWVDAAPAGVTWTVTFSTPYAQVDAYIDHLRAGGGIMIYDERQAVSSFPTSIGADHSTLHAVMAEAGISSMEHTPSGLFTGDAFVSEPLDSTYDNVTNALMRAARDRMGIQTGADTTKILTTLEGRATGMARLPIFHPAIMAQLALESSVGTPTIDDANPHIWGADDWDDIDLWGSYFMTQALEPDQNSAIATASTWPGAPSAAEARESVEITVELGAGDYTFTGYYAAPGEEIRIDVEAAEQNDALTAFVYWSNGLVMPKTRWNAPAYMDRYPSGGAYGTLNVDRRALNAPMGGPILLTDTKPWEGRETVKLTLHNVLPMPEFELGVTDEAAFQAELAATTVPFVVLRSPEVLILAGRDEVAAATDSATDMMTIFHRYRVEMTDFVDSTNHDDELPHMFFFDVQDGSGAHSGNPAYLAWAYESDVTEPFWDASITTHQPAKRGLWGYGHEMGHSYTLDTPSSFTGTGSAWTESEPNVAMLGAQARIFGYDTIDDWSGLDATTRDTRRCTFVATCGGTCDPTDYDYELALDLWLNITDDLGLEGMDAAYAAYTKPSDPSMQNVFDAWALELAHGYHKDFGPYFTAMNIPLSSSVLTTMDVLYDPWHYDIACL